MGKPRNTRPANYCLMCGKRLVVGAFPKVAQIWFTPSSGRASMVGWAHAYNCLGEEEPDEEDYYTV